MGTEVKSTTLVDWVESKLIQEIRDNQLESGAEMLNEKEISEKYEVGRNVVREALSRLRMLGIIESRKKRGTVIAQPNVMFSFKKVINPFMLSKATILDLLGMRVSLEIGCARMIIHNITDQDINELKDIVARERAIDSMKVDIEMERAFHSKLYAVSKNKVMLDFLDTLLPVFKYVNENFEDFDQFNRERRGKGRFIRHNDFIPYLEQRDVEGYQRAMEDHLVAYIDFINHHNQNPGK
ncbi:GntR family transcriptional regulator [Ravibacter arvi]|uniref:GntR family transcriptional regulator n=1 Tax=Ravibacter arvi TaxID=2051041 RepID=A0ABP8ME05_9BACT